jgi:hypothetical protein
MKRKRFWSKKLRLTAVGIRCAHNETSLYQQMSVFVYNRLLLDRYSSLNSLTLPPECIWVFHMDITLNDDYFQQQGSRNIRRFTAGQPLAEGAGECSM